LAILCHPGLSRLGLCSGHRSIGGVRQCRRVIGRQVVVTQDLPTACAIHDRDVDPLDIHCRQGRRRVEAARPCDSRNVDDPLGFCAATRSSAPNQTNGSPPIGSIPLSGLSSRGWAELSDLNLSTTARRRSVSIDKWPVPRNWEREDLWSTNHRGADPLTPHFVGGRKS